MGTWEPGKRGDAVYLGRDAGLGLLRLSTTFHLERRPYNAKSFILRFAHLSQQC